MFSRRHLSCAVCMNHRSLSLIRTDGGVKQKELYSLSHQPPSAASQHRTS